LKRGVNNDRGSGRPEGSAQTTGQETRRQGPSCFDLPQHRPERETEAGIGDKDEAHRELNAIGVYGFEKKDADGDPRYGAHEEGKDLFPFKVLPESDKQKDC